MDSKKIKSKANMNRKNTAALRQALLEKYNYSCTSCGVTNNEVPLELAHIVPISQGGENSEENLTILCPNCHRQFDRQPREFEFLSYLSELMRLSPDFVNVEQEKLLGDETRYRADIIAQRKYRNTTETLLIECKSYTVLSSARLNNVINQLRTYRNALGTGRMVLAVPATLKDRDLAVLSKENIEIWDLPKITDIFAKQIHDSQAGYFKAIFLARISRPKKPTRSDELIAALEACDPGKKDWSVYQSLTGDILEYLFAPPLGKPISELSDKTKTNRRDFILPNYTEKGFWSFLREKYEADYIVVDAKNYTRKIKKSEVLQVANYLKSHGAGLFGLIISRNGGDTAGCENTLREQWLVHRKLILVLCDEDIKEMLMAKNDGRAPEEIIGQKIEQFRLSM